MYEAKPRTVSFGPFKIVHQRPGGAEHEDRAEQVPLEFEPGVRRGADDLADDRVDRGDEDRDHDRPGGYSADPLVHGVDGAADA